MKFKKILLTIVGVTSLNGSFSFAADHPAIIFDPALLTSYDLEHDILGNVNYAENNTQISLSGNIWKQYPLDIEITSNTVLKFEFKSDNEGEIHGIGFDITNAKSNARTNFQLYGSQTNWGFQATHNYQYVNEWVSYEIPIGQFFRGTFNG